MKRQGLNQTYFIRTISFLCLILYNLTVIAQTKAELTITIKDCRNIESFPYLSELIIKKNGKDYKIIKPQHSNKQVLKDLELGTYTLIYKSLFKKEVTIDVNIAELKNYSSTICTAYLDYSKELYKPIIDSLIHGEKYSIFISSQGCFHSTEDTITIKRTNETYSINWDNKTKKLTTKDIEAIRHFEMELNYMNDGDCTTTDTYNVLFRKTNRQIEDGSCRWNGDNYLMRQIFGKQ